MSDTPPPPPPRDPGSVGPPPPSGAPGPPPPTAADAIALPRLLDVGDWLTDTTRRLVQGFGDFFAVLTLSSLVAVAVTAPMLWFGGRDAVIRRDEDGFFTSTDGIDTNGILLVLAGIFVILAVQLFLFAAATVHIDHRRRGEPLVWQQTMTLMFVRGPRVVGLVVQALVVGFVILTVGSVLGAAGLGVIAVLLTLAVIAVFWVRCAVAATHAALDLPGSSLRASYRWTKGLTWPLLGRHILLGTIVIGVLLISSFVAAPFQSLGGADAGATGDVIVADLIGSSLPAFLAVQFINAIASGVVAAVWASAMLSIFRGEPPEE